MSPTTAQTRDQLADACRPAVDRFLMDNPYVLAATPAVQTAVTIRAALGYLLGTGLITALPDDQWPMILPSRVPPELAPRGRR